MPLTPSQITQAEIWSILYDPNSMYQGTSEHLKELASLFENDDSHQHVKDVLKASYDLAQSEVGE